MKPLLLTRFEKYEAPCEILIDFRAPRPRHSRPCGSGGIAAPAQTCCRPN